MSQRLLRQWPLLLGACLAGGAPPGCTLLNANRDALQIQEGWKLPEYPLDAPGGPHKDQELVVAVLVTYAPDLDFAFAGSEGKLAAALVSALPDLAKECRQKVRVIDPLRENGLDPNNSDWRLTYKGDWGKKCWVDYVLNVRLENLSLYQPGSSNRFYAGQASVTVDVDAVTGALAAPKYHYVYSFKYPQAGTIDATQVTVTQYRKAFLDRLATELALKHLKHRDEAEKAPELAVLNK